MKFQISLELVFQTFYFYPLPNSIVTTRPLQNSHTKNYSLYSESILPLSFLIFITDEKKELKHLHQICSRSSTKHQSIYIEPFPKDSSEIFLPALFQRVCSNSKLASIISSRTFPLRLFSNNANISQQSVIPSKFFALERKICLNISHSQIDHKYQILIKIGFHQDHRNLSTVSISDIYAQLFPLSSKYFVESHIRFRWSFISSYLSRSNVLNFDSISQSILIGRSSNTLQIL